MVKEIKKLIRTTWYGLFMKYHGNKSVKICETSKKKNAASLYHLEMMEYYYSKINGK